MDAEQALNQALIPAYEESEREQATSKVTKSKDYLPRLQLYTFQSGAVKDGLIDHGHFGVVGLHGDAIEDLDEEVELLICSSRPKALDTSGPSTITSFDLESEEFQRIKATSFEKDSGCMHGPEFLVWIPELAVFATFYMGTSTLRRRSDAVLVRKRCGCHLKSEVIKKGKNSWHGPIVTDNIAPIQPMPDPDELNAEIAKFQTEKSTSVERAASGSSRDR